MKIIIFVTLALEMAILSPLPALDQWQANYRARVRAELRPYLPENPQSADERAMLRDICALSDSAYSGSR